MPAYKGEHLLKNPFLGSALLKRAQAGFQGAQDMKKEQDALYRGALESGAGTRTSYLGQVMPKHLAQKAQAEEQIDIHGYARAHQTLTSAEIERLQKRRKEVWQAKNPGKPLPERMKSQQEVSRKKLDKLTTKAQQGKKGAQRRLEDIQSRGPTNLEMSREAERQHTGVIRGEQAGLARSADIRNYFFGGQEFARQADAPTHQEQMARAVGSVYTPYKGMARDAIPRFRKEDPEGFQKWTDSRRRIEEAFSPNERTGWGRNLFNDRRTMNRGESPLEYASTAQSLFERGTALSRGHILGDNPLSYERDVSPTMNRGRATLDPLKLKREFLGAYQRY